MVVGFNDSSVISYGDTVEEAFETATEDILNLLAKMGKTSDGSLIDIQLKAKSIDNLFLEWINVVLEKCDSENISPNKFEIRVGNFKNDYFLHGKVSGRKLKEEINNRDALKSISKAIAEVFEEMGQFVVRFSA